MLGNMLPLLSCYIIQRVSRSEDEYSIGFTSLRNIEFRQILVTETVTPRSEKGLEHVPVQFCKRRRAEFIKPIPLHIQSISNVLDKVFQAYWSDHFLSLVGGGLKEDESDVTL